MNILDTDEIKLLLQNSGKWYVLLATAIFTGLRVSELLALEWDDVDFALEWDDVDFHEGVIRVKQSKEGVIRVKQSKTKTGIREVVMMPALQQVLAKHSIEDVPYQSRGCTLVFHNRDGKPMLRDVVRKDGLYPALERAGIEKRVRFHDLRHTFASILISQGCDLAYGAEQMGHASITTFANTYAKLIDGEKKREIQRERMEAAYGEVLS